MKQFTSLATIVGAIPGALPPVIGWTAVNNSIGTPALILFFIMFFWQPPHFLALAIFRKEEYERAELAMLPVESNIKVALRQIVVYSSALLPLSLLPYPLGMAGRIYLGIALIGGILLLLMGIRGFFTGKTNRRRWAKRLFFYTIIYLTCLFCGLIFDYSI